MAWGGRHTTRDNVVIIACPALKVNMHRGEGAQRVRDGRHEAQCVRNFGTPRDILRTVGAGC